MAPGRGAGAERAPYGPQRRGERWNGTPGLSSAAAAGRGPQPPAGQPPGRARDPRGKERSGISAGGQCRAGRTHPGARGGPGLPRERKLGRSSRRAGPWQGGPGRMRRARARYGPAEPRRCRRGCRRGAASPRGPHAPGGPFSEAGLRPSSRSPGSTTAALAVSSVPSSASAAALRAPRVPAGPPPPPPGPAAHSPFTGCGWLCFRRGIVAGPGAGPAPPPARPRPASRPRQPGAAAAAPPRPDTSASASPGRAGAVPEAPARPGSGAGACAEAAPPPAPPAPRPRHEGSGPGSGGGVRPGRAGARHRRPALGAPAGGGAGQQRLRPFRPAGGGGTGGTGTGAAPGLCAPSGEAAAPPPVPSGFGPAERRRGGQVPVPRALRVPGWGRPSDDSPLTAQQQPWPPRRATMEQPTRVPGPRRLLGCFRRKPRPVGEETPPQPEPEPEETRVVLALGEGQALEECPLCLLPQPPEAFPSLGSCSHRSCRGCLQQYLRLAVTESRVPVSCPHCPAALQPHDVHRLLPEPALRDKYEEFLLRRLLVADPGTRWCPAPDCSYAVLAHGCAECPRLTCGREGCGTEFCYHCRQPWHPEGPCAPVPPAPSLATPTAQLEEPAHAEAEDIKVCPRCSAFIMKINDGSCNRMNCTVCGCLFCWLCLQEISDVHFLSPSGCTFWGKRPWSRTRRILWQLGMVLGAPMVISLAAGVAVPVITIGIPIYMGRKVLGQSRRSSLSGCQQCLSVTSSVLLSLFVSPIITALTVGVGVPLVLTYVYGTVVLSLCRSRWGCRGGRAPGDLGAVELDNLAKLNELWSVLPSPRAAEDGAPDAAASLPSSSRSPRPAPAWPEQDSQSASTVALAGSMLSEGQDTSDREGVTIEVEVSVEVVPRSARQQSLSSALSGQSLSGDSLGATSDRGSSVGVPVE